MARMSPRLQTLLDEAPPGDDNPVKVIITLDPETEWEMGVRQVAKAGLHITGQEEAIRVVFGRGPPEVLRRITALSTVSLIEAEERAAALE